MKADATSLLARLTQEESPEVAGNLGQAYASVTSRLTEPLDVKDAVSARRPQLAHEWHDTMAAIGAEDAYKAVVAHCNRPCRCESRSCCPALALRQRKRRTDR